MLRLLLTSLFTLSIYFLMAQATGEFDGTIQSNTLMGTGDRNVVADPSGVLKIGPSSSTSSLPANPVKGEMTYFDGTNWVTVPPGTDGQTLTLCNCVPTWGPCPQVTVNLCDTVAGGVVFWLDGNGGGLVASMADVGTAEWGCFSLSQSINGADGTAIGTGQQNTADILAGCPTPSIAADICNSYSGGGFNDWFLPSIDELSEMYFAIGLGAPGGSNCVGMTNFYWSSTETVSSGSRVVNFTNGSGASGPQSSNKDNVFKVRAVRAF